MKETELKLHPCYCGGEMGIKKVTQNSGMDGSYLNWELTCKKCGMTMTYAADGFYGRKYKTFEEVVDDWNHNWENKADALDKIKAEIEALPKTYPFVDHMDMYVKVSDVEKIIDKYRSESEDGE